MTVYHVDYTPCTYTPLDTHTMSVLTRQHYSQVTPSTEGATPMYYHLLHQCPSLESLADVNSICGL
jgi:hypothetical protein